MTNSKGQNEEKFSSNGEIRNTYQSFMGNPSDSNPMNGWGDGRTTLRRNLGNTASVPDSAAEQRTRHFMCRSDLRKGASESSVRVCCSL
jgi:hypothetical protein